MLVKGATVVQGKYFAFEHYRPYISVYEEFILLSNHLAKFPALSIPSTISTLAKWDCQLGIVRFETFMFMGGFAQI